jgi:hypothetical protein
MMNYLTYQILPWWNDIYKPPEKPTPNSQIDETIFQKYGLMHILRYVKIENLDIL